MFTVIREFFVRLWTTIQVLLADDKQTPEDIRRQNRMRKQDRVTNKTGWGNPTKSPVLLTNKRANEVHVIEDVIKKGTLEHLSKQTHIPMTQYYKLQFAGTAHTGSVDALAYVEASEKSAVMFLYEPSSTMEPYKAFLLCDGKVTHLNDEKTLDFAKRILSEVPQK